MRNRSQDENVSTKQLPTLKLLDFCLRISVIPLSVATIWLTLTNNQNDTTYGKLEFNNLLGLKYMVLISMVSALYALIAAVFSWIRSIATKAWLFFLTDQIVAYLMVTAGAAVIDVIYLAYNGDKEVSWSEACTTYGRFCSRMKFALVFHMLSFFCFLVMAVISAYRVFSMFEPPLPYKEVQEQRT